MNRRRLTPGPITLILVILGLIFTAYLVLHWHEIKPADLPQILLMIGLVTITAIYARSTEKIAKATKEQLLSEARPYLLLRLNGEGMPPPPKEFTVTIRNAGKGPAINLWAALWGPKKSHFGDSKGYLAPGEEWQTTISRLSTGGVELGIIKEGWLPELRKLIKQEHLGVVAVKYNDIHHRVWVSYLCLERHVDVETFVIEGEQNIVELKKND